MIQTYSGEGDFAVFAATVVLLAILHFIPSFVAFARGHARRGLILLLNVLMGWTIIGWAALLYWASRGPRG